MTTKRKADTYMKKDKMLKIISGFGIGAGVGLCFGVAMDNIWLGLLLGLGVGSCYAVAFTSNKPEDKNETNKENNSKENSDNEG